MEAFKFLDSIHWLPPCVPDVTDYISKEEDSSSWKACDDLFGRSYWKRTWILQEVLHEKEVVFHLGNRTIPIEDLSAYYDKYYFSKLNVVSGRDAAQFNPNSDRLSEHGNWRYDGWFQGAATAQSGPNNLFNMRQQMTRNPNAAVPRLSKLLHICRDQEVTSGRDKIFAMRGMAQPEYNIPIDCGTRETGGMSTGDIFTITTRQMLTRVLMVLLWVESPSRKIASSVDNENLPSWVPDFTTKQSLTARTMHTSYNYFSADVVFPGGMSEKNSDPSLPPNHPLFVVRGSYVGCITGTHYTCVLGRDSIAKGYFPDFHLLKLIRCDQNPILRGGKVESKESSWSGTPKSRLTSDISFENSSWGPCKAEIGDIIIVAAGCKIPLVLRKHGENYLLVGGCWLINKRIKDFRKLQEQDDGFAGIMFGAAVKEIGSGIRVEEFVLC